MKIAVTYEQGLVFQHFGHTTQFKIYNAENSCVTESYIVDTLGHGHGALAGFLMTQGVEVVICGGIGMGAINALSQFGIKVFGGVTGDCDEAVELYLAGELDYNPDVRCSHHDHEHGEGHVCGEHGCGSGNCSHH